MGSWKGWLLAAQTVRLTVISIALRLLLEDRCLMLSDAWNSLSSLYLCEDSFKLVLHFYIIKFIKQRIDYLYSILIYYCLFDFCLKFNYF